MKVSANTMRLMLQAGLSTEQMLTLVEKLEEQGARESMPPRLSPDYRPTYLYVIGRRDPGGVPYGPFKVGISHQPEYRLYTFNSGSPVNLHIVRLYEFASREDAYKVEQDFHSLCAAFPGVSHHGEWVKASLSYIDGALPDHCRAMGVDYKVELFDA